MHQVQNREVETAMQVRAGVKTTGPHLALSCFHVGRLMTRQSLPLKCSPSAPFTCCIDYSLTLVQQPIHRLPGGGCFVSHFCSPAPGRWSGILKVNNPFLLSNPDRRIQFCFAGFVGSAQRVGSFSQGCERRVGSQWRGVRSWHGCGTNPGVGPHSHSLTVFCKHSLQLWPGHL